MYAVSCSLQLPHELGIRNRKRCVKNMVGRVRFLSIPHSSHDTQLDALSLHLSSSIWRPISSIPSRHNLLVCRSTPIPGPANYVVILKTTATALMRLYNSFKGSSLMLQLAPAVGVIAFALWCLEPLVRQGRNLCFHRTDSSWKKSNTHYVLTSYLQPLLLWAGASLACRALDPLIVPSEANQAVKQRLLYFVRSMSNVLALAYCLTSFIRQAQKLFVETNDSNDKRNMGFQFAAKAVYSAVCVAAVSLFMELLGFSTQKWLTAGGFGTVLLTLAGREILTNFLSSVMLHTARPFIVNEWIQTKIGGYEVSGTVEHVGWWSPTIIRGDDREAVHIPNHKFTMNVVRNLTQKTHWRIKTHLAISHLDANKINIIIADMRKVLAKNPQVEQQRLHRRVFLDYINPESQALLILVSCFVKTSRFEEYLCVKEAILLDLLRVISHHHARLATPIRTVLKRNGDADMEDIPFSDTILTRARAATEPPFILVEPSYKINAGDKIEAPGRPVPTLEGQDVKVSETSTSVPKEDMKVSMSSDSDGANKLTSTPSDSKVDGRITEVLANTTSDPKVAATTVTHSMANVKVAVSSSSSETLTSDLTNTVPVFHNVGKESSDKQPPKESSGDATRNSNLESVHMTISTTSSISRPSLEENIVLGVALDGSKRTLPIEEEMNIISPSCTPETKELQAAACLDGNGSQSAGGKDTKVGQIRAVPGAMTGGDHQRDKER